MLVKVVAVQARLGRLFTLEDMIYIFKRRPDFVCLPEFFMHDETTLDYQRAALRKSEFLVYLEKLSYQLSTCLFAGTVVEAEGPRLYNTCYVIDHGRIVGRYRKRYPVPGELKKGITPGTDKLIIDIDGVRASVLICGDVFHPEIFSEMADDDVDLVFVPTTSPFRPDDSVSRKAFRDRKYFISGAGTSVSYVIKVCGVGKVFGMPLQGRSLVTAPWGLLDRIDSRDESRARILSLTLDIAELREFRSRLRHSRPLADKSPPSEKSAD